MLKRNISLTNNLLTLFFILANLSWANFKIIPSDNIFNFVFGINIGILIFPISLFLCNYSVKQKFFFEISKLIRKNIFTKEFLLYCLVTACIEEYIWRYSIFNGILSLYVNKEFIAIISILSFFCIHLELSKTKKKNINNYIDIFLFSIILVVLYYFINSLLLVIGVHLARNLIVLALQKMELQSLAGDANIEGASQDH